MKLSNKIELIAQVIDLFEKAKKGDKSILNDPKIDKMKDEDDNTPLHWLAKHGIIEVLDHPSVSKVKNKYGRTPLHHLAINGFREIAGHPDFNKVKDNNNNTPRDLLLFGKLIDIELKT